MAAPNNGFAQPHLATSGEEGFSRLRVDPAQTGFFEGREFRTFYEFSIPSGQSVTLKFACPVDFIMFQQALSVDAGGIRLTAITGATESTPFNTPLPVIGKNRMTSRRQYTGGYYAAQETISSGGSVTGGTVVEAVRVVAANATSQRATVGGQTSDERGLPAGSYYLKMENLHNGTTTGVYSLFWEDRP